MTPPTMKAFGPRTLLVFATLLLAFRWDIGVGSAEPPHAQGIIATVQPLATEAGLRAFRQGGNAIDAAVAAAITLGVVDGHNSGLGGGCFVLIRQADGQVVAIDGRETAPAAATEGMFLVDGVADPQLSRTGPLAVAVPGALAAYREAVSTSGRLNLNDFLKSAAEIADDGFAIDAGYARKLKATREDILRFPATAKMLIKAGGGDYATGDVLSLPDLARSYRRIAGEPDWFYEGEFADEVAAWMRRHGGLISKEDFAAYRVKRRTPLRTTYRGYEVIGFPPPSSGGVHVAQILNILENFDLPAMLKNDSARAHHVIAEAMKLAFADRAHWLGDADFADVPRGLAGKPYARTLAAKIDVNQTTPVQSHGTPNHWRSDLFRKHTTHIAAADADGNWVAITATINTTFGSKVVVPGTGIVLNNEMDDFSAQPGVPNAFGLVGGRANAVQPGKRPLSSMSPTIVLKDGVPVLTVGAAGGPKIITQVVLAIVRTLDGGRSIDQAVSQPRIHHQWIPAKLFVEAKADQSLVEGLKSFGHRVEYLSAAGVTQAIRRTPDGRFVGVADPRAGGTTGTGMGVSDQAQP